MPRIEYDKENDLTYIHLDIPRNESDKVSKTIQSEYSHILFDVNDNETVIGIEII